MKELVPAIVDIWLMALLSYDALTSWPTHRSSATRIKRYPLVRTLDDIGGSSPLLCEFTTDSGRTSRCTAPLFCNIHAALERWDLFSIANLCVSIGVLYSSAEWIL